MAILAEPSPSVARAWRLGLAVAAFAIWGAFAWRHEQVKPADFDVFWEAARHWRAPYDPALIQALEARLHITGAWPFVYPPTFLLLAWPFAQAPLALAYPLWAGLSAAVFIFAAAHLVRPPWLTLALFVTPPVVLAISPGQTSLVVGAAMIGAFLAIERRPALAGLLFAVAACIKPQAMALAPIVLFGQWRALAWAAAATAGFVLASLVFGPGLWLQWPHALAAFARVAPATDRVNPSALGGAPLAVALAALGVFIAWRERTIVGLVTGGLCLTPYAHQYDLAPLAPVALGWIAGRSEAGWLRATAGAALLAGFVSAPLGGLGFVLAVGASKVDWRAIRRTLGPGRALRPDAQAAATIGP